MSQSDDDRRAAAAVVQHHSQLAETLATYAERLRDAAADGQFASVARHREALSGWLRTELLPHAYAEETALYPAAAEQPDGRLLVDGMLAEHQAITTLVNELESATTTVDAAAAARALTALFAVHLAKENDLILPLLLAADDTSVAALLDGMHEIVGASDTPGGDGCGCGCACGGDTGSASGDIPALTIDTRLDVRDLPRAERHARVLAALDALPADGALVLVAPHAPHPLLAQIDARYGGRVNVQWLQEGPEVWQLRLHRQPVAA